MGNPKIEMKKEEDKKSREFSKINGRREEEPEKASRAVEGREREKERKRRERKTWRQGCCGI